MNKCIDALDDAINRIEDMKEMLLADAHPDTPLVFFEAYQDVNHQMDKAVTEAIAPLLTIKSK
jgi:hypothetical protein